MPNFFLLITKNKAITFFVSLTFLIYLSFGLYHINRFETADEHYWVYYPNGGRVFQYWDAVSKGNWAGTYVNDKPGITVALVSGLALLSEDGRGDLYQDFGKFHEYDPGLSMERYALYRIPILIFNGTLSFFFLWAIWKMTGNSWLALWSWILILLSPVLLGISQIVNPDSLLWPLATAVILSFLLLLQKQEKKFVFLTAVFFGLSLLTKYTAIILIPFFYLAGAVHLWLNFEKIGESMSRSVISFFRSIVVIIACSSIVFAIFLPAVLADPSKLLKSTEMIRSSGVVGTILGILSVILLTDALFFGSRALSAIIKRTIFFRNYLPKIICAVLIGIGIFTLINWGRRHGLVEELAAMSFDLERTSQFKKYDFYQQVLAQFRPLVFSLTPIVLLGIISVLARGILGRVNPHTNSTGIESKYLSVSHDFNGKIGVGVKYSFLFLASLAFVVLFLSAMIQQKLLITFRYGIVLYPILSIMAAIGIWEVSQLLGGKKALFTMIILTASVASLWMIAPFYFNYANNFLYSGRNIADAWGYGGYEAAQYLNSLPDAENLVVWPDYRGFCPFFEGKCFKGIKPFDPTDPEVDYFVKTRKGSNGSKDRWDTLRREFLKDPKKPVWSMVIDGHPKNFIEIYEAK